MIAHSEELVPKGDCGCPPPSKEGGSNHEIPVTAPCGGSNPVGSNKEPGQSVWVDVGQILLGTAASLAALYLGKNVVDEIFKHRK
jgi:hypothetical protein